MTESFDVSDWEFLSTFWENTGHFSNGNAIPYEKYLYQSIGAIYVPYMSPIISIGEL